MYNNKRSKESYTCYEQHSLFVIHVLLSRLLEKDTSTRGIRIPCTDVYTNI